MKQCFGYVRVSTVKQGEGVSLQAQKEAIERFADHNQITISEWFEEKETAAKTGRPIFNAMVKQLRRRKARGVVMHKIDRSARNFKDWAVVGDLADAGIDVHFATESLDFRSRGGRLSADIQAVIAADYIRNLREETIKGLNGRLKQGLYPWGAPIGYRNNGGGRPKTPDPITAPLVRQAFELYASGEHSMRTLRVELDRLGLRNAHGKPLTRGGIETMLNNPFYCGLIHIKRTGATYNGAHEPIITPALFQRVQDVKSGKSGKKVTRHNHLFRGLFRCGLCGGPMIPERQKGLVYYRCHASTCPTKCVRESLIDAEVIATLSRIVLTNDDISWLVDEIGKLEDGASMEQERRGIELQLSALDARLERLTDAMIDQLIDKETFNGRKQGLMVEQAELQRKLKEVGENMNNAENVRRFLELIKTLAASYMFADPQEKRSIIKSGISNRTVIGKSLCLEPSDWLREAENCLTVLRGAHRRATNRTGDKHHTPASHGPTRYFEVLTNLARSNEVIEVYRKLENPEERDSCESRPLVA